MALGVLLDILESLREPRCSCVKRDVAHSIVEEARLAEKQGRNLRLENSRIVCCHVRRRVFSSFYVGKERLYRFRSFMPIANEDRVDYLKKHLRRQRRTSCDNNVLCLTESHPMTLGGGCALCACNVYTKTPPNARYVYSTSIFNYTGHPHCFPALFCS
jgi:hypothetical protein